MRINKAIEYGAACSFDWESDGKWFPKYSEYTLIFHACDVDQCQGPDRQID